MPAVAVAAQHRVRQHKGVMVEVETLVLLQEIRGETTVPQELLTAEEEAAAPVQEAQQYRAEMAVEG